MATFRTNEKYITVPLSFVTGHMADAHGAYVKVYLYGLAAAVQGLETDNKAIAKSLKILVADVENAWKYWAGRGLLEIKDEGIVYITKENEAPSQEIMSQETISQEAAPQAADAPPVTPRDIAAAMKLDPGMKDTVSAIERLMGKPLNRRAITSIFNFMDWYGMDKEVVVMLFEYCVSLERRDFAYIEKVAQSWRDNGINDVKSAEAVIKRANAEKKFQTQCKKIFGLERAFTPSEIRYINSWKSDMGFSTDMVSQAYEITVKNTGKLAFAYMNKILTSWSQKGIKTPESIQEKDKKAVRGTKIDDIELIEMRHRMNLTGGDGQ